MASFHYFLQHNQPRVESPAKVFAKLKSKVQREAMCATEPPCHTREKHGGDFSREENSGLGFYRREVKALTLSPISSPQKDFGYSYSHCGRVDETPQVDFMFRKEHTPTKRRFLESTSVFQPLPLGHRDPPQAPGGFPVSSRTPTKTQPAEGGCVRRPYGEDPRGSLGSPAKMLSPLDKRLRKRKWEQQEARADVRSQLQERDTSTAFISEDSIHSKTRREEEGGVRGFPAGVDQATHAPMFPPPRPMALKRAFVMLEKYPPMSPAKLFAYMKERENKRGHEVVHEVNTSSRKLFSEGNYFNQTRDSPLPTSRHNMDGIEDSAFTRIPENTVPANHFRDESADSQSDLTEDVPIHAPTPQPVLLEDPLVLNSPKISIPKKRQCNKWSQRTQFPNESVIYLEKWFLRNSQKGLFLDGVHSKDNVPWNSNVVVDRVSSSVVKTVSGRVYVLVGKMNFSNNSGVPKWLMKKFSNGFPPNWKSLYEKSLTEEAERTSEGKSVIARTKSEASSNQSVKPSRQNFKTPESCPPALSSSSSAKTSRSGRLIKPPLEYWKGGRVVLDAHMNVTIHECYDTSICIPEVTTTVSARKSPARVFLPCTEGRKKRSETSCDEEAPAPLRKVKAPLRNSSQAKLSHDEKPSNPPEPSVETIRSPEVSSGRTTRSRSGNSPLDKTVIVDTVPQKQKKPVKATTKRLKKQTREASRSSERASPESSTDETSLPPFQSEGVSTKRKEEGKGVCGRGGQKGLKKPQRLQSSESSGESGKRGAAKKNTKTAETKLKQNKGTKRSPPAMPQATSTLSSRRHKTLPPAEQDEDPWTEAELMKLQDAVANYPKHISGYWAKVAKMVETRSAEECHRQHTSHGAPQTPSNKDKKPKKPRKGKVEVPKDPVTDRPVISARVGTLRRKQQVRQFLEAMPTEDVDDVFSSAYMQNKRYEMPSMCPSEDHEFTITDLEPLSPTSRVYPEVKTPQCLHITPGMMGSPDRENDDKYVYQLQKRMRKNQFNVAKHAQSSKNFTPSVKQTMRRCGNTENDTFVVWEMFPGDDVATPESDEEEDFYFSDSN